jgi:hypothetical protein
VIVDFKDTCSSANHFNICKELVKSAFFAGCFLLVLLLVLGFGSVSLGAGAGINPGPGAGIAPGAGIGPGTGMLPGAGIICGWTFAGNSPGANSSGARGLIRGPKTGRVGTGTN